MVKKVRKNKKPTKKSEMFSKKKKIGKAFLWMREGL